MGIDISGPDPALNRQGFQLPVDEQVDFADLCLIVDDAGRKAGLEIEADRAARLLDRAIGRAEARVRELVRRAVRRRPGQERILRGRVEIARAAADRQAIRYSEREGLIV